MRQGKPASGRPRLGYIWDREADTYTPDPATAPLVAEMYRRYIDGHGSAAITRWLNEKGSRTRYGHLWQATSTMRTLDHGFAAGKIWHLDRLVPGVHEPIIDEATWDAYVAKRASHAKGPRGSVRMLSGLLKCECGGAMCSVQSTATHGVYGCARKHRGDPTCPYRCQIDRANIEEYAADWITSLPDRADVIDAAVRNERRKRIKSIDDRAAIARMIQRTENRLATLTMKLIDGDITQTAYDVASAKLDEELGSHRARYIRSAPMPATDIRTKIPELTAEFRDLAGPAQNRVARMLVDRIIIHPATTRHPGKWRDRVEVVPRWDADTTN